MKRMMTTWVPAVLLLVVGTGCGMFQTVDDAQGQQQRIAALEMSMKSVQEKSQQLDAQVEELKADLAKQNEINARSTDQARQMAEELATIEKRFSRVDETSRQRLAALQEALAKESSLRQAAIKSTTDNVAQTIAENNKQWQAQQAKILSALKTAAATPSTQGDYVVQKGDTLTLIAQAFGVSAESIRRANGLKSSTVHAGQKLVIPAAGGSKKSRK